MAAVGRAETAEEDAENARFDFVTTQTVVAHIRVDFARFGMSFLGTEGTSVSAVDGDGGVNREAVREVLKRTRRLTLLGVKPDPVS